MIKIKSSLYAFSFLLVSLNARGSVLQQQDGEFSVKSTLSDNLLASNSPKKVEFTVEKETEPAPARDTSFRQIDTRYNTAFDRLKQQAISIKEYAIANNYNAEYCILVDMSIPSGKKRLFVYNLNKDCVEKAALVAHGFGSYKQDCDDQLVFSNAPFSFKTSIGKYKIGHSYSGTYGLSYKLFGLDSTNNRAYERAIVLHADKNVPDTETYPFRIFQSAGCPTVSQSFLPVLNNYIKGSRKALLMWIYN